LGQSARMLRESACHTVTLSVASLRQRHLNQCNPTHCGQAAAHNSPKHVAGFQPAAAENFSHAPEQLANVDELVAVNHAGQSLRSTAGEMQRRGIQVSHVTVGRLLRDHAG